MEGFHQPVQRVRELERPKGGISHPLLESRPHPTSRIKEYVESRGDIDGTAQRQKLLMDLHAAYHQHREPPVEGQAKSSSRLHLEMLLGKDEKIDFADYLPTTRANK